MSDVFISYSRLDRDFVGRLRDALHAHAQEVWIDWESIPPSQAWWDEIKKGIARANNFVVVLSPSSMASPVCHLEIEYARQLNKRIIPVLHLDYEREPSISAMALRLAGAEQDATRAIWGSRQPHAVFDGNDAELKHINYFFFRTDADFDARFQALFEVIRTDYAHKEQHTTLELRAMEWDRRERNPSFLLLDDELADAEAWLAASESKEPAPSELHRAYIAASRHAEDDRRRLDAKRQRDLRQARFGILLGIGAALLLAALAINFNTAREEALTEQRVARQLEATANTALTAVPPTLTFVAQVVAEGEAQLQIIESQRLAALGERILSENSGGGETAALLMIRALRTADTQEARDALQRLIDRPNTRVAALTGHSAPVNGIEALPDGRLLSWSWDGTLRLWSAEGAPLAVMEGHTDSVYGVLILDDGAYLSYAGDGTLRLWDAEGAPLAVLEGHMEPVNGVEALDDGRLLSWAGDGTLRLWDAEGAPLTVIEAHEGDVRGVQVLDDGRFLSWPASGAGRENPLIRLWSPEGEPLLTLEGPAMIAEVDQQPDGRFLARAWSGQPFLWSAEGEALNAFGWQMDFVPLPDGRLITWDEDGVLSVWAADGAPVARLEGHSARIWEVHVLPDGRFFSSSFDGELRLWELRGETPSSVVFSGHTELVWGVEILADGRVLSWSVDGTLRLWTQTGESLAVMQGHSAHVEAVEVLADGRLLSRSADFTLRLWTGDGAPLAVMQGHSAAIHGVHVLDDGRFLSWSADSTLRLWDADGAPVAVFEGHQDAIGEVLLLPNGRVLSRSERQRGITDDVTPRLWALDGLAPVVLRGHRSRVDGARRLPEGGLLSWSWDNTLRLWGNDGTPLAVMDVRTLEAAGVPISGAELLPNRRILSWMDDPESIGERTLMHLWDADGSLLARMEGPTGHFWRLHTLPDGRFLTWHEGATRPAQDRGITLWSAEGEALARFEGHQRPVIGVAALPGGDFVSWGTDGALRRWSATGAAGPVMEAPNGLTGARLLPDGRLLSWDNSGGLYLWSAEGALLQTMAGHTDFVWNVQPLPDGRLLSWAYDSAPRLWSAEGEALAVLEAHQGQVGGVAFLPDGRFVSWSLTADGSLENTLRLWSAEGEALAVLEGHSEFVFAVEPLPNGGFLTQSARDTLHFWSADGHLLHTVDDVSALTVQSDGRVLTASGEALSLWSEQGEALARLNGHRGEVFGLLSLPDGRALSWSADATLRLWYLERAPFLEHACGYVTRDLTPDERAAFGITDETPTCPQLAAAIQ